MNESLTETPPFFSKVVKKDFNEKDLKNFERKININGTILTIITTDSGVEKLDLESYAIGSLTDVKNMISYGKQYFIIAFGLATFITVINFFGFLKLYEILGFFDKFPVIKNIASVFLAFTLEFAILFSGITGMKEMFENSKKASKIMGLMAFIPFALNKAILAISHSEDLTSKGFLEPFFFGSIITILGIFFSARIPEYISEAVIKMREIYFYKLLKN